MPLFPDNTGASNQKFNPPNDAPPNYGQQIHHDAGPYQPPSSPAPNFNNQVAPASQNFYGAPTAPDPAYGGFYNNNPQVYYGQPGPGPQGYYGQPQQMYYGQPGPQPGYGHPGYGYGPPQQGYYGGQRGGPSAGEGICAGLLGALACCCCLDLLF